MAKNNLAQLRAEVMRSQSLAKTKMRRIRKSTGAVVEGTPFDPTRPADRVAKYNSRQLKSYARELEQFRRRETQFVGGAKGAPIPRAQWNRYQNVQASYNRVAGREFTQVESVTLPGGQTVGGREALFLPENRSAGGRASNRPRGNVSLRADQIASADALPALENRLRSRMTETYYRKTLKRQRFELTELLSRAGMSDLAPEVGKLSDAQFNTLWNYTDFPEFMSARYESVKNQSVEEEAHTSDEHRREVESTLGWARKIR